MFDFLFIIAIVCALSSTTKKEYIQIIRKMEKNRKAGLICSSVLLAIFGYFIFPLTFQKISSYTIIIGFLALSFMLYGCLQNKPILSFGLAFLFHSIGFICKIIIEWGEVNMIRDLTIENVLIHLVSIPFFVLVFHLIFTYITKKSFNIELHK